MTATQGQAPFDPVKEVRFAVVMYGGVSLAIYIHGVTQELYRLVRATAPGADGMTFLPNETAGLRSTERIYRKLGQFLEGDKPSLEDVRETDPVRTRFVVDILSGTSAGGINAVYLAKALANDQPIDQLKGLWVTEGDIGALVNDKQSIQGLPGMKPQSPPASLLNSQRMYIKLLDALDGMEAAHPSSDRPTSPYVDELALFVTATDIRGLTMPIRLGDNVVHERRHRHVFRFYYSTGEAAGSDVNDFVAGNNPFLAFAARCTSAFPFAFEPMTLGDVKAVLEAMPDRTRAAAFDPDRWARFYKDYAASGDDFLTRAFGDGGYLDNKPFSYATELLLRRRADLPVDRKLIYIEPSPQHPEMDARAAQGEKPDALENVTAALVSLPRYETIREDLQRLFERNRVIERVRQVLQLAADNAFQNPARMQQWLQGGRDWAKEDLAAMIERYGVSYGAYHQLRVAQVTDDIAAVVCRINGFDEEAGRATAVGHLVEAWRRKHYAPYRLPAESQDRATENEFLFRFDMSWRLRRLVFVLQRIDDLHRLDEPARLIAGYAGQEFWPKDEAEAEAYRLALRWLKRNLNDTYVDYRARGRQMRARGLQARAPAGDDSLKSYVEAVKTLALDPKDLDRLLEQPPEQRLDFATRELLEKSGLEKGMEAFAAALNQQLREATRVASWNCKLALELTDQAPPAGVDILIKSVPPKSVPEPILAAARKTLSYYYEHYEYYDMVTFPLLYATPVGEADVVEVIRVSPEDATSLIDEQKTGRKKLAGVKLGHFGAFFVQAWRENDMLWGRLDGAERIITALLPRPEQAEMRAKVIAEAHQAILEEELHLQQDELYGLLGETLARSAKSVLGNAQAAQSQSLSEDQRRQLTQKFEAITGQLAPDRLKAILPSFLQGSQLLDFFVYGGQPDPDFPPEPTLKTAARATQVIGQMLEALADKYQMGGRRVGWIARLGQLFWSVVQVAVPGSFANLLANHWLKVLYVFEAFAIVGGVLLGRAEITKFGWAALGYTLAFHLLMLWVGRFIRGAWSVKLGQVLRVVLLVVLGLAVFVLAALELRHIPTDINLILRQLAALAGGG